MLRPRWHKVLRDLWANKTRTLLVVLSISVGVFAIGTIASTRVMLAHDLSTDYADINPSSAILFTAPFDDGLVRSLRQMRAVREAEGRFTVVAHLKTGPDEWRNVRLEAIDDYHDIRLDKVRPESGQWPPPRREVLIERASLKLINRKVGDLLTIQMPDGRQHDLRIAGSAHDLNKVPASFSGTPYGYITFDTLEWLGYPRSFNALHLLVDGNAADKQYVQSVIDQVKKKVEQSGRTVYWMWIPEPGTFAADDILQPMVIVLAVLAILSLLFSGFLVINTIAALLMQQVRQIGMMKSMGASNGQIMGLYLATVLIFGLLSLSVAIPIASLVAYGITRYLAGLINFNFVGYRVPLQALALEIAVGLLVPLMAALYPIAAGVRVTVRAALSYYGIGRGQFGRSLIDRLLRHIRGLSRPLLLSFRNTFRRKLRLMLTLATLTVGGAIFIAVFSVRASLVNTLDEFTTQANYDISVDFDGAYGAESLKRDAMRVPGVVTAENWGGSNARRVRPDRSEGSSFMLNALPTDTRLLRPVILEGRWLRPNDKQTIVLDTDALKSEPDIRVGDQITLKIERRETTWRLVGIAQTTLSATFIRIGAGYVSLADFTRIANSSANRSLRIETTQHDAAFQASVATALKDLYDGSGIHTISIRTTSVAREAIRYQFNILTVFLSIIATLLAVVGALSLMGMMSMNVHERARDIGVMRAIGASDRSMLQTFMVEGICIGVLSWPMGAVLAVPISKVLTTVVGDKFTGAPLSYTFSLSGALLWLVLVAILAALATFLPAWNATRLSVREVLSYE